MLGIAVKTALAAKWVIAHWNEVRVLVDDVGIEAKGGKLDFNAAIKIVKKNEKLIRSLMVGEDHSRGLGQSKTNDGIYNSQRVSSLPVPQRQISVASETWYTEEEINAFPDVEPEQDHSVSEEEINSFPDVEPEQDHSVSEEEIQDFFIDEAGDCSFDGYETSENDVTYDDVTYEAKEEITENETTLEPKEDAVEALKRRLLFGK